MRVLISLPPLAAPREPNLRAVPAAWIARGAVGRGRRHAQPELLGSRRGCVPLQGDQHKQRPVLLVPRAQCRSQDRVHAEGTAQGGLRDVGLLWRARKSLEKGAVAPGSARTVATEV